MANIKPKEKNIVGCTYLQFFLVYVHHKKSNKRATKYICIQEHSECVLCKDVVLFSIKPIYK